MMLVERFPELSEMRVLDLGGTADSWVRAGVRPSEVILLNVHSEFSEEPWLRFVEGDACSPPTSVRVERFDLVYCNSLIDQVGGHERRLRLAETIHGQAPHHWVQTAYRYFPLDAYFLFPWFASLPPSVRGALARRWRLASRFSAEPRVALEGVLAVELLTKTHMRYYFPHSELLRERFIGLTKSLIATR